MSLVGGFDADTVCTYIRRMARAGHLSAVEPCGCSHPFGLHDARNSRCLCADCKCESFKAVPHE